jgi:hypothetical protein
MEIAQSHIFKLKCCMHGLSPIGALLATLSHITAFVCTSKPNTNGVRDGIMICPMGESTCILKWIDWSR